MSSPWRRTAVLPITFILVVLLVASLASSAIAAGFSQVPINVSMLDNAFQPQNLSVPVGTTVIWTNNGNNIHSVTSDTGLWDSTDLQRTETFSFTFVAPGLYPYHCRLHQEMRGTVTVAGTALTVTPTPTSTTPTPTLVPGAPTPTPTPTLAPGVPTPTATATPTVTPLGAATATPTTFPGTPSIQITSPANGQIMGQDVTIRVLVSNFNVLAQTGSLSNQPGQGRVRIFLDGQMVQAVGTDTFVLTGLAPGSHTIRAELRNNDDTQLNPLVSSSVTVTAASPTAQPGAPVTILPNRPSTPGTLTSTGDPTGLLPLLAFVLGCAAIAAGVLTRIIARR